MSFNPTSEAGLRAREKHFGPDANKPAPEKEDGKPVIPWREMLELRADYAGKNMTVTADTALARQGENPGAKLKILQKASGIRSHPLAGAATPKLALEVALRYQIAGGQRPCFLSIRGTGGKVTSFPFCIRCRR